MELFWLYGFPFVVGRDPDRTRRIIESLDQVGGYGIHVIAGKTGLACLIAVRATRMS